MVETRKNSKFNFLAIKERISNKDQIECLNSIGNSYNIWGKLRYR